MARTRFAAALEGWTRVEGVRVARGYLLMLVATLCWLAT